jgi:hypothetical protein
MRATDKPVQLACLLDGSRMSREVHVRFCERLGVQLPGPTSPASTLLWGAVLPSVNFP